MGAIIGLSVGYMYPVEINSVRDSILSFFVGVAPSSIFHAVMEDIVSVSDV